MVTKEQFETFKYIYEKEEARFSELINRGKVYLSIITVYIAVVTLKVQDIASLTGDSLVSRIVVAIAGACFILALICCIMALGILRYERLCNLKQKLLSFPEEGMPDSEFYEDRLADMAVADDRNSRQNNRRAILLQYSSYLMLAGVCLHLITYYSYLQGK